MSSKKFVKSQTATPVCLGGMATLRFDGFDFNRPPRVLALSNLASRADGNDTLLIVNRFGGNWRNGAMPIGEIQGTLYDDAGQAFGFLQPASNCQLILLLSDQTLRITPRFSQIIPASRSGWLKFWATAETALLGAAINFSSQTRAAATFNQGHNLHHLSLAPVIVLSLPIRPPIV